jgi:hypothetical protein
MTDIIAFCIICRVDTAIKTINIATGCIYMRLVCGHERTIYMNPGKHL